MRTLLLVCVLAAAALAEDRYFSVPLGELELPEAGLPDGTHSYWHWRVAFQPRVVCEGDVEAYLAPGDATRPWAEAPLVFRCAELPVQGTLYLPDADWSRLVAVPFKATHAEAVDKARFDEAQRRHYTALLARDLPGGAWFRHRLREASGTEERRGDEWPTRGAGLEDTFDLLTGGRAVSENLQLGRELPAARDTKADTVPLASLEGITVKEMDWAPYLEGVESDPDPLARFVPADQYAVFFPSFDAFVATMDAADAEGTPILGLVESRAEDARTKERYERQLCLRTDALSRALGPKLIRSMAVTGSDPYLRTGTDVAVVFEGVQGAMLRDLLIARRHAAAEASGVAGVEETAPNEHMDTGITLHRITSPDRAVSSYLAHVGDVVVVANSEVQLTRILQARTGANLAGLDEYRFFRSRYARGEAAETAFLVLPDAAIRKWCGPKWRIACSRRVRAAAVLGELTARHRDAILAARPPDPLDTHWDLVDLGTASVGPSGVRSSVYNTQDFLTPIAELEFDTVTAEEARLYRAWRGGYQSNWSQFFDPIAVRLTIRDDRLAADVTVMPLILGTEYGDLSEVSKGARLDAAAGDRHAGALFHAVLALNTESEMFQQADGFASMMLAGLGANPLGWVGSSVALYLDDDPVFAEAARAEDPKDFMEKNLRRLPVAVHCAVKSPLRLAAFLTALRGFVLASAPGLVEWENRTHGEQPYVVIRPSKQGREMMGDTDLQVCYATRPDAFLVTLSEDLLRRALDRHAEGKEPEGRAPLLGDNLNVEVDRRLLDVLDTVTSLREEQRRTLRVRCWDNLPILNEWKRLYPDRDPVEVHERLFGTRLVCPGGGTYRWNAAWHTMESTAYGHPGEAQAGPAPLPFDGFAKGRFGLTFERDGLRASCELLRPEKE